MTTSHVRSLAMAIVYATFRRIEKDLRFGMHADVIPSHRRLRAQCVDEAIAIIEEEEKRRDR